MHIKFRYKDSYTNGEWSYQECIVKSMSECIEIYGLNEPDVYAWEVLEIDGEDN